MLRVLSRRRDSSAEPEQLLNIVDRRTLQKLLASSGGPEGRLPAGVNEFLQREQLIASASAVDEVRAALRRRTEGAR
jgi:hypothetical protein